jgi:hypothetical protein
VIVEVFKVDDPVHPLILIKSSEDEYCEEVCWKSVSTLMPTLHTNVKSGEIKKNPKVHLKEFLLPFDDGKPKVKMCDVMKDGDFTQFVANPKPP